MNLIISFVMVFALFGIGIFLAECMKNIQRKRRIQNLEDHQRFFNKQFKKWWER